MATVTFPPALGGDGSTVTDDASPTTGLANGGHRERFVPALAQAVAVMSGAVTQANAALGGASAANNSAIAAAASAASAINAPGTSATSATSLTVGTGAQALTLSQTGKAFVVGQWVSLSDLSLVGRWMAGQITAFNSGSGAMTVQVVQSNGSGASTTWAVAPTPPVATIIPTQWPGVLVGRLV